MIRRHVIPEGLRVLPDYTLDDAPQAYADFQDKADGMIKTVFRP